MFLGIVVVLVCVLFFGVYFFVWVSRCSFSYWELVYGVCVVSFCVIFVGGVVDRG